MMRLALLAAALGAALYLALRPGREWQCGDCVGDTYAGDWWGAR